MPLNLIMSVEYKYSTISKVGVQIVPVFITKVAGNMNHIVNSYKNQVR